MRKLTLTLSIFLFTAQLTLASAEHFKLLKEKIANLENSIIQDFSIDSPKEKSDLSSKTYVQLAAQVEVKYNLQKKLFFKIEDQLYKLDQALAVDVSKGLLTKEEASSLKTNIEYAQRIILRTRKSEINEIYSKFMQSLSHTPKLTELYTKLSQLQARNCSIENVSLDSDQQVLSFQVKKVNKFGGNTTSHYKISAEDITQGHLSARLENRSTFKPFHNLVTQYWNGNDLSQKYQKFTLLQSPEGDILEANFNQKETAPLVEFMGISFGNQTVKKSIDCISKQYQRNQNRKTASESISNN